MYKLWILGRNLDFSIFRWNFVNVADEFIAKRGKVLVLVLKSIIEVLIVENMGSCVSALPKHLAPNEAPVKLVLRRYHVSFHFAWKFYLYWVI